MTGHTGASKAEIEACEIAVRCIRAACEAVLPVGQKAILDALMSVYLSLAMEWIGLEHLGDTLRQIIDDLPRFAAAIRAENASEGGHA